MKISNLFVFRTVEDAGPYINEVCANIVRSIVGRGFTPAVFGIRLLKASPCGRGGAVRRRRGAKKYQIYLFLGPSRTPVPTIYGFRASAVERTYFVGVGAYDDPEKQSIIAIQPSSPLCALKTFRWKFFGATFFQKR